MKSVFALILLSLLLAACSTNKRKEVPINSLKDVMLNISPLPASFEINAGEENLLKGEKGTVVYIPADAFQLSSGQSATGKIQVLLKECYSVSEMIAENLSTVSDNRILQTGGMINIVATLDGKELELKKDKAMVIGFPKNNSRDTMDLFYNYPEKDGNTNWIVDYKVFEKEAILKSLKDSVRKEGDTPGLEYPIEMTEDLYDYSLFSCGYNTFLYDVKLKGEKKDTTLLSYMERPGLVTEKVAREFVANEWRVAVEFRIDKNGKVYNIVPFKDELTKYDTYAFTIVKDILANAPAFDLASSKDTVRFDWKYYYSVMGYKGVNWDRFREKFRGKFSEYKNKAVQKLDKTALDYYMFSATKMGWINCDRFLDLSEEEKTDFVVNVKNPNDANVKLIFEDMKSIMNGTLEDGRFVFNNIPLNRKIKIIGISYKDGKPSLSLAKTTVKKEGYLLKDFKEFSLDELETALNARN